MRRLREGEERENNELIWDEMSLKYLWGSHVRVSIWQLE